MKTTILFTTLGLSLLLIGVSCKKNEATPAPVSAEGKWVGNYHSGLGGPVNYFALNFKTGGVLDVEANSAGSPDVARGTWNLASDSIRGSFTYLAGTMSTYSFATKYSSNSNIMNGTLGTGVNSAGAGIFSVTKQ